MIVNFNEKLHSTIALGNHIALSTGGVLTALSGLRSLSHRMPYANIEKWCYCWELLSLDLANKVVKVEQEPPHVAAPSVSLSILPLPARYANITQNMDTHLGPHFFIVEWFIPAFRAVETMWALFVL